MTLSVVVPVLSLLDTRGLVDRGACANYAQCARETWLDRFLVGGSLGLGFRLSEEIRRELLEIWLENVPGERLLMCVWRRGEMQHPIEAGVRPVFVLRDLEDGTAVLRALEGLPADALVYSHPQYTNAVLTPAVVEKARSEGTLPAGAKVSKVELNEVRALRDAAGPEFALFDGRCRHVRASVEAGATGVVAVPLTVLPEDLPPRENVEALQAVINRGQAVVDTHPDVAAHAEALRGLLLETL